MRSAQRFFVRTTVAALFALAATSAHAIPITFTFAAAVKETLTVDEFGHVTTDVSHAGDAVTGSMVVETEGLFRSESSDDFATFLRFFQRRNAGLFSSALNIGGIDYDVGAYANESGTLQIVDSAGLQSDGSATLDSIGLAHSSNDEPLDFLSGVFNFRTLQLSWFDPDLDNRFNLVDLTQPFDAIDVVNVPRPFVTGAFTEEVETCDDNGDCFFTSKITNFLFGSLSVSAPATQVPEPGTLGLCVLGLLGLGGMKKWRSGRDSNPRPPA